MKLWERPVEERLTDEVRQESLRVGSGWERVWTGGGTPWTKEEFNSVKVRQYMCVNERETGGKVNLM